MNLFLSAKTEHSKNIFDGAAQHWRLAAVYGIRLSMLSVVIQTHNDEDALARTLASLVSASVDGVVREVIICDAGSTGPDPSRGRSHRLPVPHRRAFGRYPPGTQRLADVFCGPARGWPMAGALNSSSTLPVAAGPPVSPARACRARRS